MTGDDMKKMLLIAIITMLATMGLFAVDPAIATFDITAVKDYVSSDVEWTPSFSYEELYESKGDELLDGREIEINPAQLNGSLDLFRVNYITNNSRRKVTMTVTTEPFINESADTIGVTYHFSDAVYVKDDNSAEWENYVPDSNNSWPNEYVDAEFIKTSATPTSASGTPYVYNSPDLYRLHYANWSWEDDTYAALPYDSVKYALTVAVSFSSQMDDVALKDLAGTYKLPVTVTITSED